MTDIASCVAGEVKGVVEVIKVYENTAPDNLVVDVSITIGEGSPLWETAMDFQQRLAEVIEYMTAFNVVKVDVEISGIARGIWG